jgi:hypothetical protein
VYVQRKEVALKSVRTPGRIVRVPNQPRTQHRSVRVSDEDWGDLDTAAKAASSDRASLIKQFIRWYLPRPGAELPERPRIARGNPGAIAESNTANDGQR